MEEYQKVKHLKKHAVYLVKSQSKQEVLNNPLPGVDLLHLAKEMRCKGMDVQVGKSVCNDTGKGGWTTGLSKLPEKSTVFDSQEWSLTGTQTTSQESTHVNFHPPWSNEGYDSFREDPYRMGRVV